VFITLKSKSGIRTLTLVRQRDVSTWIAPFPATLEGMNDPLYACSALLHQICASATITTNHYCCTLGYTTRLHKPATTTHVRDHITITSTTSALVHHISNALQSCDARHHDAPTSRPTTQLRSPSDCLAPLSDQAGASRIYILRPLLCTPLTKSPNSATTSVIATPGNAPDIISQDRVDKCASTGQYRPTRGGRWDAGGKRARRAC